MSKRLWWQLVHVCLILAASKSSLAIDSQPSIVGETPENEAIAFYIENDSRSLGGPGSDQAFSDGFKFSYIYAEDKAPKWSKSMTHRFELFDEMITKSKVNYNMSIGHQIYTPDSTDKTTLIKDDRPYAAWLYAGVSISLKEKTVEHFVELNVGMVGPSALGKEVQNNFHNLIKVSDAEGWRNGLHDEPTLQVFFQNRFKYLNAKNFDLIPFYGAAFGNVAIGGHFGGLVRFGLNLLEDFGPGRPSDNAGDSFISPGITPHISKGSYYIFTSVRGNAIARNIFLDGNSFESGPSVKKYPFTFETDFGLGMKIYSFAFVWRFVTRSPEFEERSRFNSFASLNIVYFY